MLKHLKRNWIRTASPVLAMAVCISLFCTLQTFIKAVSWNLQSAHGSRLVTRHNVSLVFGLPLSYEARLAAPPGVKRVSILSWFGGSRDINKPSDFFPNMAVEPQTYFPMYPEYIGSEDQKHAFFHHVRGL